MTDLFDNIIVCKKCNKEMQKVKIIKNGFMLRAAICKSCGQKNIHPLDEEKYNKYKNLKNKEFKVKMRLVGNSYAVSIPKEIVSFMKQQEKIFNDIVRLGFEEKNRLFLSFNSNKINQDEEDER